MLRSVPAAAAVTALLAAAFAAASAGQGPPGGSPPGLQKAIAAKEKHAQTLLDTPGVAGVGVGLNRGGQPVIKIYKEKKDADSDLPASLDGVPVDTLTTGVIVARAPTDRFPRPVPIGVSSGLLSTATGTLGARVSNGSGVFALSNNHVYAGINTGTIGSGIIQPGSVDGGSDPADRIGTLYAFQQIDFSQGASNTIDAAIALTSPADVGTATPPGGYGEPSPITTQAFIGQAVQKYGRTTGLQLGTVSELNVSVDVCYLFIPPSLCLQEARFVNQIGVTPDTFSAGGDSGSLIVTQGGNQPVALLFAGGEGRTVGNPIDLVLQRFGVTIDGAVPPDGPPTAPTALAALAGADSVSLSWGAPSWDGGSPVTSYSVYRGTSPGSETFLATVAAATSFVDTSVTNGVTYYYKVSATNANGEGPLSAQATATPSDLVPPTEPLPVVDGFDRADENPLSDGGKWGNGVNGSAETGLTVASNTLACTRTTTCTGWRSNAQYGPNAESWARVSTSPGDGNALRLYVRVQSPGSSAVDGYMLVANVLSGPDQLVLYRITNAGLTSLLSVGQDLAAGDTLLLRAVGSTLEAWHRGAVWARVALVTDATYGGPGYAGVGLRGTTGRLDDFGARTLGQAPPGAPTNLAAAAGDGSVALSWSAPALDGGSPVTGYRVYRGTSAGSETFLADAAPGTSFVDAAAANGTTFYYKVAAVNANGEGPLSTGASATPSALVEPMEPLPTLDSFDRANESPLSDGGRWGNGVNGSAETGLTVMSNTLACSKTTTCTAWRQDQQYGPDTEAWVRISTLPGGNNQIRLHARVQQPGTAGYDGYVLRAVPLSGVDQVNIDRVDNGTFVNLLATSQELAAGDVLLLRAVGTTLEAWYRSGSAWSRLGTVADTTYPAAGFVGVGVRGTVGRLDDFGARTFGALPPDTEDPTAPGNLQATASTASDIDLTWQAATDNVGVTQYRIERCQGAGCSSFSEIATTASTGYANSGLSASTEYSYRVLAEDAAGNQSPYSNTASATTPGGVVAPVEPLPILDSFNRRNENPLSDSGRWSNGVIGSAETGLRVNSNTLSCTRTTTCTAWRNSPTFGPDTEVWARITTLPGTNNQLRLFARLQQPGSSAHDGYMLRTYQVTGTDQLYLERIDNSAVVRLQTVSKELAVGDVLLLRVEGATLEAWHRRGTTWSLLGSATDSTYAIAGYIGVGIRGKTGRLDDFGGR